MPTGNAIRAGRAFVELFADDSRLRRGLARAQKMVGRFADRIRAGGVVTLKVGVTLLGGAAALAKTLAGPASELEEVLNKFDVVFGDRAEAVKGFADQTARELGRSKIDIKAFLAEAQDLFVPLGFDAVAAEAMSKTITRLGVDLASFNNLADADVIRDLQSALTGSSEVMKKYGVIVNEAAVKQEALNQGLDPRNLTETQKVASRLAIILRGTTAAQGDAERSANSYANVMKRFSAVVKDARAALGAELLPVLSRWITAAAHAVGQAEAWARANRPLLKVLSRMVVVAIAAGAGLITLGAAAIAGGLAVAGLAKLLGGVVLLVKVIPAAVGLASTAFAGLSATVAAVASPLGLAIGLIAGVAGYVAYASGVLDLFGDAWKSLSATATRALGGIRDALAAGDLRAAMRVLWAGLKLVWARGVASLTAAWVGFRNEVLNIVSGLWTRLLQGGVSLITGLQRAWASFWAGFNRMSQRNGDRLLKLWIKIRGRINGEDVSQQLADVDQISEANQRASRDGEGRELARLNEIERQTNEQLALDRDRGEERREERDRQRLDRLAEERLAAEREFADALGEARRAREKHEADLGLDQSAGPEGPKAPDLDALLKNAADAAGGATDTAARSVGGFNAAVFDRLFASQGPSDAEKKTAANTGELVRLIRRQIREGGGSAVFA
ncbi:MAG: hypothetical protein AAGG38_13480 [Planctomycetota bacterium]